MKKVLVTFGGYLGNLVWARPLLGALKERFGSVSIVVSDIQTQLARSIDGTVLDAVWELRKGKRWQERWQIARDIRNWAKYERKIDIYIDLAGKWKTQFCIPLFQSDGVYVPSEHDSKDMKFASILHRKAAVLPCGSTNKYEDNGISEHMIDAYLRVAEFFSIRNPRVELDFGYSPKVVDKAKGIMETLGMAKQPTVILCPSSAKFSKIWPVEKYKDLAAMVQNQLGAQVVVIDAEDYKYNQQYGKNIVEPTFRNYGNAVLISGISLMVNCFILRSGAANVIVADDSFPSHQLPLRQVEEGTPGAIEHKGRYFICPSFGVIPFGPTDPRLCAPYGPEKFRAIVKPDYSNLKCIDGRCDYYGVTHICRNYSAFSSPRSPCMNAITLEQMFNAVSVTLAENAAYRKCLVGDFVR